MLRSGGKELAKRINTLDGSKKKHEILESSNGGNYNRPASKSKDDKGEPTGSTTFYNAFSEKDSKDEKRNPAVVLTHEFLGHGYDSDQGKTSHKMTSNGIRVSEVDAVKIENKARTATGDPQRTTYGGKPIPSALLKDVPVK